MNSRRKFITGGTLAAVALLAAKPVKALSSVNEVFFPLGNADTFNLFYANNSFQLRGNGLDTSVFKAFSRKIKDLKKYDSEHVWLDAAYSIPDKTTINEKQNQLLEIMHDVNSSASIETIKTYSETLSFQVIKLSNAKVGVITENTSSIVNPIFQVFNNNEQQVHLLASKLKNEEGCSFIVFASSNSGQADFKELAEESSDIDVVLGIIPTSKSKIMTVKNKLKNEVVLINQAGEVRNLLRNLEVTFDGNGLKKSIQFNNFFI